MLNIGLFRFCAAVLIVNWVHILVRGFLLHIMSGESFLYPLEPLWPTLLLLVPIACVVLSLVKKNARLLKIISALCIAFYAVGAVLNFHNLLTVTLPHYHSSSLSATCLVVKTVLGMFLKTGLVVYIAAFFTMSAWRADESREKLNLPLLRVLAMIFAVSGLGGVAGSVLGYLEASPIAANAVFPWQDVFFSSLSLAAGILAFVKKNAFVLKVYALFNLAVYLWSGVSAMFGGLPGISSAGIVFVDMFLGSVFVFNMAAFFVEPEKNRLYLQKVKALFFRWKSLT